MFQNFVLKMLHLYLPRWDLAQKMLLILGQASEKPGPLMPLGRVSRGSAAYSMPILWSTPSFWFQNSASFRLFFLESEMVSRFSLRCTIGSVCWRRGGCGGTAARAVPGNHKQVSSRLGQHARPPRAAEAAAASSSCPWNSTSSSLGGARKVELKLH